MGTPHPAAARLPPGTERPEALREAVSEGPNRGNAGCDKWSLVTGPEPDSRTDTDTEPTPTRKLRLREDA